MRDTHSEKRQLIGSAVSMILIAALMVIIGRSVSVAWFSANERVSAGGNRIEVMCSSSEFDLGSVGTDAGYYRDEMSALGISGVGTEYSFDGESGTSTASATSVYWNMTVESNLLNETGAEVHKISPGSTGLLTFYVIPHRSGDLHVELLLSLIGYRDVGEGLPVLTSEDPDADGQAPAFLEKHLCFFTERTGSAPDFLFGGYLSENRFSADYDSAEAEVPIPVTLYWFWPGTLADVLGEKVTEGAKEALIGEIGAGADAFFRCTNLALIEDITAPECLRVMLEPGHRTDYNTLSYYYNQADQIIGMNCDYLLLKLATEEGDG